MERRDRKGRKREREREGGENSSGEGSGRGEGGERTHFSFLFQWDELDCTVCWVLHRSVAFDGRF